MSANLTVDPSMRASSGAPPRREDRPVPPRSMARSAAAGNRKRAWPRWTRPALKGLLYATPLLLALAGAGMVWQQGRFDQMVDSSDTGLMRWTAGLGFAVDDVMVEGRIETERDALLQAININRGDAILGLDLAAIKARVEELPWVSGASIERRLPDTIFVRLSERQPMAIWQHERKFIVIDRNGRPLADAAELARRGNQRIDTLPQVVGANAPAQVPWLLAGLDTVPSVRDKVVAATWVSNRRWNLKLANGVMVKLPETDMGTALLQLAKLDAEGQVFERDIVAIDMRQPDRAVLQTSATAVLPGIDDPKKKSEKRT